VVVDPVEQFGRGVAGVFGLALFENVEILMELAEIRF
jgi:hypothetical protein